MKNIGYNEFDVSHNVHVYFAPFNFEQVWSMFSPAPPAEGWYYLIEADLESGQKAELIANGGLFTWETSPYTAEKPQQVANSLKNHRWFKYFENGYNSHKYEI